MTSSIKYQSFVAKALFIHLIFASISQCKTLELEYFQIVKRHFDVPEKATHVTAIQQRLPGTSKEASMNLEDGDISITAFGLSVLIFAIISILLTIVVTYFCFSAITGFCRFILMHRYKHGMKSSEAGFEAETSSLDSVVYELMDEHYSEDAIRKPIHTAERK